VHGPQRAGRTGHRSRLRGFFGNWRPTISAFHQLLGSRGAALVLCGLREQPRWLVSRSGFAADIGAENLVPSLAEAWRRARVHLAGSAQPVMAAMRTPAAR
jgi:hypothetical protein